MYLVIFPHITKNSPALLKSDPGLLLLLSQLCLARGSPKILSLIVYIEPHKLIIHYQGHQNLPWAWHMHFKWVIVDHPQGSCLMVSEDCDIYYQILCGHRPGTDVSYVTLVTHITTLGPLKFPDSNREPCFLVFFAPWCPSVCHIKL